MQNMDTVSAAVENVRETFGKAARESMGWRAGLYSAVRANDEAKFVEVRDLFADDLEEILNSIFWTSPKFKQEARQSVDVLRAL